MDIGVYVEGGVVGSLHLICPIIPPPNILYLFFIAMTNVYILNQLHTSVFMIITRLMSCLYVPMETVAMTQKLNVIFSILLA